MATFKYKAMDKSGNRREGEGEAGDEQELKASLKNMGLILISAEKKGGLTGSISFGKKSAAKLGTKKGFNLFAAGITKKDITIISRQLATMISSGVSLLRSIQVLATQAEKPAIKAMMTQIKDDLSSGTSLSQAMAKHPKQFEKIFVSMIRAGEASGALETVLKRLADFMEAQQALAGKVKGAMMYPIIVLCVAFGIVFLLLTFVVPKFTKMFVEAGMKLPSMTQLLVDISYVFSNFWWAILGGIIGIGYLFKKYIETEKGRFTFDLFMLKMPLFGSFTRKVAVGRFTRTMGTLLNSGVPILTAFDIVADTVGNVHIANAIHGAKNSIKEGATIAKPLADSGQFPLMVTQMIEIGEESGAITEMLEKVADFNEREVNEAVEALVTALEPLTIVFMAVIVGFIVVALFQPLFMMSEVAGV